MLGGWTVDGVGGIHVGLRQKDKFEESERVYRGNFGRVSRRLFGYATGTYQSFRFSQSRIQ